jgi:hypothetical protein
MVEASGRIVSGPVFVIGLPLVVRFVSLVVQADRPAG